MKAPGNKIKRLDFVFFGSLLRQITKMDQELRFGQMVATIAVDLVKE